MSQTEGSPIQTGMKTRSKRMTSKKTFVDPMYQKESLSRDGSEKTAEVGTEVSTSRVVDDNVSKPVTKTVENLVSSVLSMVSIGDREILNDESSEEEDSRSVRLFKESNGEEYDSESGDTVKVGNDDLISEHSAKLVKVDQMAVVKNPTEDMSEDVKTDIDAEVIGAKGQMLRRMRVLLQLSRPNES